MNGLQVLIEQMIADISTQAARLEEVRLRRFLQWLRSHHSTVLAATPPDRQAGDGPLLEVAIQGEGEFKDRLKPALKGWFESLPLAGLLWEYHFLLVEINWWQDLDPRTLAEILKSEGEA